MASASHRFLTVRQLIVTQVVRDRILEYRARVQAELKAVYSGEEPPETIAGSFAFGTFVTALPSLGTGFIVLGAVAYKITSVNILALFAPVVVLNPLVKGGVYAASLAIGVGLLGPVAGIDYSSVSLGAAPDVVTRLLVGNFILAVLFAIAGYGLVDRGVRRVRQRNNSDS